MKTICLVIGFCLTLSFGAAAQNSLVDSLRTELDKTGADTNRVYLLLAVSKAHFVINPDDAIAYATLAKELSQKLGHYDGVALAYKNIGIGFFNKGQYVDALQYYEQSLAVYDSIGDKVGQATLLKNTGNIFYNQGDDDKALEYYIQSLKVAESIPDTHRMMEVLINIGAVYSNKPATFEQSFYYLRKAYALCRTLDDNNSLGAVTVNLGEVHMALENYDSALHWFNESLIAYKGSVDEAYTLNNIGKVFMKQRRFDEAIRIQKEALAIAQRLDSQNDVAISLVGIAESYEKTGDVVRALVFYHDAEEIANETGAKYSLVDIYAGLARVYEKKAEFGQALYYQHKLADVKDAIYNLEIDRKLGTLQFTYDLEKKGAQINLLTKDREIKEKELTRQKYVRNGFIGGFAAVLLFASVIFTQRNRIAKEKQRSEELLLNILPEETAAELKQTGKAKARAYDDVTVLFTDFKGFSKMAETMSAEALVNEIDYYFRAFDRIIKPYGIEKIKTIGDAYMAACGLPAPDPNHAFNVIKAAMDMRDFCAREMEKRSAKGRPFFEIRIGVNSGPVVAGIVGESKFAYDIWGDTVNMAARMEQSGTPGKVNISESTYALVNHRYECVHRGKLSVKHKDGVEMYYAEREIIGTPPVTAPAAFTPDDQHPLLKNAIPTKPVINKEPVEKTRS